MTKLSRRGKWKACAIGVLLLAALVIGGYVALGHFKRGDDFAIYDDPKRTISLLNDTGHPRVVRRCERVNDCRSADPGDLVQPGESFEFKVYLYEERTYVVGGGQVATLGCVTVHPADGRPNPESLSNLTPCPGGTPKATRRRITQASGRRLTTRSATARLGLGPRRPPAG